MPRLARLLQLAWLIVPVLCILVHVWYVLSGVIFCGLRLCCVYADILMRYNCSMFCMCTRSGSPHNIVCARDESYFLTTVTVVKKLLCWVCSQTACVALLQQKWCIPSYRQQSLTSAFCPTPSLADQRWSATINYATRGAQLSTAHKLSSLGLQRANLALMAEW